MKGDKKETKTSFDLNMCNKLKFSFLFKIFKAYYQFLKLKKNNNS